MANKDRQFNVRLDDDLWSWLATYSDREKVSKTSIVEELLRAKRDGRLIVRPVGPDAFPNESRLAGTTEDYPALISFGGQVDVG